MPNFKRGDRVAIINRRLNGEFIVEGRAVLVREGEVAGQWHVRFPKESDVYLRFVDVAAQADPSTYVEQLNAVVKRA